MLLPLAQYEPRVADLLGFSAAWNEPSGWIIKATTLSRFSHVAGVGLVGPNHLEAELRRREWPRRPGRVACGLNRLLTHVGYERRMLLFESTTQAPRACCLTGEATAGVQAQDPRQRIAEYPGRVWLFRPTPDFRLDANQVERLTGFLLRHLGDGYDLRQALISGTRVLKRCRGWARANLHSLFCSEYWAAALEQVRLLELSNPSVFNPGGLLAAVVGLGSYECVGRFDAAGGSE